MPEIYERRSRKGKTPSVVSRGGNSRV